MLSEARNPFSILTKSTLVLRDLDLLVEAAGRTELAVNLSIGTLDEDVWRTSEPGTPHPRQRVGVVARLREAGIRCGVLIAPVLPGLSDRPEQLARVVDACLDAGAASIVPVVLHLRPGVREPFMRWLEASHPTLVTEYRHLYRGAYAPGSYRKGVADLVSCQLRPALTVRRSSDSSAPR